MTFQEYYLQKYYDKIQEIINEKPNAIFVILGQPELLLSSDERSLELQKHIADTDTFLKHGNEELFDEDWRETLYETFLGRKKDYLIISYPQYFYFIKSYSSTTQAKRIKILNDNLRNLFPLDSEYYIPPIEDEEGEIIEKRPENLPDYQAEQVEVNGKYFYSIVAPLQKDNVVNVFNEKKELQTIEDDDQFDVLTISSDDYSLDIIVNDLIENNNFSQQYIVKHFLKENEIDFEERLRTLNYIFNNFNGSLYQTKKDTKAPVDYVPNEEYLSLLRRYWGENANFRTFKVYKNPGFNKEIVEISQEVIISKIINEYNNSIENQFTRDLFLTAPTGSGKSLLFQLPAFYISERGDVTIVVTPLISLMKDQVHAIKERGFEKVEYLNSELSLIERERIINSCKNGETDILYMSPELLLSYDITYFIGERNLGLLVIDEAHLVTTWGRDFRVDYWFLGNYIKKTRKYHGMAFPLVALTATAVYDGPNDMVFDTIDSLGMRNPYIYIGQLKRDDITFVINNEEIESNYEENKIRQTVDFIKGVNDLCLKTLVYAPYTSHVEKIFRTDFQTMQEIAVKYHGKLNPDEKEMAFYKFKTGEKRIMIATKAFGMGVDIPDIQVVYHHAPSGLLPDYVQEIGRVARKSDIKGYATLNYSTKDQRYSKALHGMSSIKQYQLREVLKKIYNLYQKNDRKRNLLISSDDFSYIFSILPDAVDQKVLTSLMMLEKDYLQKTRFNVLIVRPKKLFVTVYARIQNRDYEKLIEKFGNNNYFQVIRNRNDYKYITIHLDKLWKDHFSEQSFPVIKRKFYEKNLFSDENIEIKPLLKLSYSLNKDAQNAEVYLKSVLNSLNNSLALLQNEGFFNKKELTNRINLFTGDIDVARKLADFIISAYADQVNGFLQQRRIFNNEENRMEYRYRIINNFYLRYFESLLRLFRKLFINQNLTSAVRYIENLESSLAKYIRLGHILEILDIGTFDVKGGDKPMIFIRINDPARILRDAQNKSYNNKILSKTLEKHYISNEIFDHFFLRKFSNEERWNFIEDFFLGMDMEDLIEQYPGEEQANNIDIIEFLRENENIEENCNRFNLNKINDSENNTSNGENSTERLINNMPEFLPQEGAKYYGRNYLTLSTKNGSQTKTVNKWIEQDPVRLYKNMKEFNFRLGRNEFEIMRSKIKNKYPEDYKKIKELKLWIEFPGYDRKVQASIPFDYDPVKFYKWWLRNNNIVYLSKVNKIRLFNKVNEISPETLRKKDRDFLNNPNN